MLTAGRWRGSGRCPQPQEAAVTTSAAEAEADDVTSAADMRDGQGRTSTGTDADMNRPVRHLLTGLRHRPAAGS